MTYQPGPGQPPYPTYPVVYAVRPPTEPTAVIALIGAIFAFLAFWVPWLGVILALVGVTVGHLALRQINRSRTPLSGRGLAIAALVTGYVALVGSVAVTGFAMLVVDAARQNFG